MKFQIKMLNLKSLNEIPEYWSTEDRIALLKKMDFPDAESAANDSLMELLLMAITDFEPNDAAEILLDYKLGDKLNGGQIQQISNDMLLDKIAEEYPEIGMQYTLFQINQLLYKAFNGKFPNTQATGISCTIQPLENEDNRRLSKEEVLLLLSEGLSERNLVKRLFTQQMEDKTSFPEAENILWELSTTDNYNYYILTSEYWIGKEDFVVQDFEGELNEEEEEIENK